MSDILKACPFCGETEHLSLRSIGSITGDMPARPYCVVCSNIEHDNVSGPVDYGKSAATAAWNRRPVPSPLPTPSATQHHQGGEVEPVLDQARYIMENGEWSNWITDWSGLSWAYKPLPGKHERRTLYALAQQPLSVDAKERKE